jgi:long-chain acyl-CoA synthetase
MKRDTLLDFFDDRIRSKYDFIFHDDGYRSYSYSYDKIRQTAIAVSQRLSAAGIVPTDKVVIWGENSPQWIAAMWGCLLARATLVPIDFRASGEFLAHVTKIVNSRIVFVGTDLDIPPLPKSTKIWPLSDLLQSRSHQPISTKSGIQQLDGTGSVANDMAEIIFTSGATAEPKGVQLTHHNILANIVPIEREIAKYRKYARPFAPLRFLNLLPLSHMFGQAMSTFVPPMLSGVTVFMRGYNPGDIMKQVHDRRISIVVCVPKILDVLRKHVIQSIPELAQESSEPKNLMSRWWHYRRVHRMFGFKFWAFVVGAAPLDPKLEAFWSRLGFLVIQGYGLTETAPIVTLNHPFRTKAGTVGTPIGGVDLKISPDGEILVRGDNVTSGYYNAPNDTASAMNDGWFHTGDIGSLDSTGRLTVKGRKKEVIVTSDGLNVFPEDVERVLEAIPGVREAGVVGALYEGQERVHAVILLDSSVYVSDVLSDANARLEEHQKIRGRSVWPGDALPRTEGTQKLKRRELKQWVENRGLVETKATRATDGTVRSVVQRFVPDRMVTDRTKLEELGLSSIERIELLMALEQKMDRTVDELSYASASTVGDLQQLLDGIAQIENTSETWSPKPTEAIVFPDWNASWLARTIRWANLTTWLLPLTRFFARINVEGLKHLKTLPGPVVYAANHQSHLDAPVILAALPYRHRYAVATAAAKEFFAPHFHPLDYSRRQRFTNSLNYYLAVLLFNVFPLPQREAGTRDAIRYVGELLGKGTSVLIFPEGRRTDAGEIGRFQPGIGMVAARLQVPIIPVRLEGLDHVLHKSWRMAKRGRVRVAFGLPLALEDGTYQELARRVEDAVKSL